MGVKIKSMDSSSCYQVYVKYNTQYKSRRIDT